MTVSLGLLILQNLSILNNATFRATVVMLIGLVGKETVKSVVGMHFKLSLVPTLYPQLKLVNKFGNFKNIIVL